MSETATEAPVVRAYMLSGWCAFPQTEHPEESHARCTGGNTANPNREFQPCPCWCHLSQDRYECGCGAELATAPNIEAVTGEDTYVHVDEVSGNSKGEYC